MYICENCHKKRQDRKALEAQPLQWVSYKTKLQKTQCHDCSTRKTTYFYQYLNAFELAQELEEAKEKINAFNAVIPFPLSFYHSAEDMLNCRLIKGTTVVDCLEFEEILRYTAELEEVLKNT